MKCRTCKQEFVGRTARTLYCDDCLSKWHLGATYQGEADADDDDEGVA